MTTTVIFYMWGQRCKTNFTTKSELDPLTWIKTCYEQGWMIPVSVREGNLEIYNEEQLRDMLKEYA